MTGFLASVRSAAEAELVVSAGADIVDLKEPRAGALGALSAPVVQEALSAVAGRRPVSATIGDLPMEPVLIADAVARTAALGVDFVKIGVFPGGAPLACLDALEAQAARGTRLVALLFADCRPDFSLIDHAADCGFAGVMLDTMVKDGGTLRDHLDDAALARFAGRARARGLLVGFAGSLALADIPALVPLAPDYLGFRGALCQGARQDELDFRAVQAVRAALSQTSANSSATAAAGAQFAALSAMSASALTSSAKSR